MERKITLKELSSALNFSISTVSKALNDSHEISQETKEKIKKFASEHNYVPNELAQSLKGKKVKTIGVIIPDILAHFFAKSLHGIETAASEAGYKIIICISNESNAKESQSINTLINSHVDGIIISLAKETQATGNFEHLQQALKYNIPVVLFDRISEVFNCDKITINDVGFAQKATEELLKSGCRNVMYLSTIKDTSVDHERQKGYESVINKGKLKSLILTIKDYHHFEDELLQVLKNNPIDGILAADELSAVCAMRTVLKHGYKIPDDISVIGFTNGVLGENFIPSLTTVDQNAEEQGKTAVEIMVGRIEKSLSAEPVHKIIDTSIIHRNSTRNPVLITTKPSC